MDEINFLKKLSDFGVENGYFEIAEIGKLDKSCCQSLTVEVIDFDKTEEYHRKHHNYQCIKSCDALKLLGTENSIDFIEMKGLKEFINRQLDSEENVKQQVNDKVAKFDFSSKIRDSITILNNIVQSNAFNLTGKDRTMYHELIKKYIILTDIDINKNPLEAISMTLEFLAEASTEIDSVVFGHVNEEINNLNIDNYYNIQKPMLMSCKTFSDFY